MGCNRRGTQKLIPDGDPQHKLAPNKQCIRMVHMLRHVQLGFVETAAKVVRDGRKVPEKSDIFRARGAADLSLSWQAWLCTWLGSWQEWRKDFPRGS